ncbi:hypothetical protein H0H92_002330 [Tricholoma furcatifolium]|nr:hypothetical protein H0H92_002330 [Tricholoma furcatifolium]
MASITAANSQFSFETALHEAWAKEYVEDPFLSPSPLSSPPTSRSPSPTPPRPPLPSIPSHAISQAGAPSNSRKRRNKAQSKARRQRQRLEEQSTRTEPNPVRAKTMAKFAKISASIPVKIQAESFATASTGFIGRNCSPLPRALRLDELVGPSSSFGFRLVKWDGKAPIRIVDECGRIIVVCAGQAGTTASWEETLRLATEKLEHARKCGRFPAEALEHARGSFPTMSSGFSHGGGRKEPQNQRSSSSTNALLVADLVDAFEPIAGFQSSVFAHWAPRLHAHYKDLMSQLCGQDSKLKRNWAKSVFASAVFNLGPRTVCFKHRDFANIPYGWCAVTALGSFDSTLGGHIVLWDLGLVIEFPSGSTILLPSAVIAHSNAAIQENETRYSFTQYTAGGLFRWAAHGMKSNSDFMKTATEEQLAEAQKRDTERWKLGLGLFSTEAELQAWAEGAR